MFFALVLVVLALVEVARQEADEEESEQVEVKYGGEELFTVELDQRNAGELIECVSEIDQRRRSGR